MHFEFYFLKFNLHSSNLNEVFAFLFSASQIRKSKTGISFALFSYITFNISIYCFKMIVQ